MKFSTEYPSLMRELENAHSLSDKDIVTVIFIS